MYFYNPQEKVMSVTLLKRDVEFTFDVKLNTNIPSVVEAFNRFGDEVLDAFLSKGGNRAGSDVLDYKELPFEYIASASELMDHVVKLSWVLPSISSDDFSKFVLSYYRGKQHQRLGQAFCDEFNIIDREVFYEEDTNRITALINKRYVYK